MQIPGLRANARRRGMAVLATAVMCIGCTTPAALESHTPSISAAVTVAPVEPTAAPSPTSSGPQTAAPSPSATASDGRADIAEVVTTDLVVRSLPGTGPESQIYSPSLSAPTLLYVIDGPVAADGYDWYRVVPFEAFHSDQGIPSPGMGWVAAASKDGEAWIGPWTGSCPEPTADGLMYRPGFLALACFGDQELTLEGTFGECHDSSFGTPSWLAGYCVLVPFDYVGQLLPGFGFHLPPGTAEPSAGQAVRVTGHYDHPAALTCEERPQGANEPLPPEVVVLQCRASFVATEITPTSAP